MPAAPRRCARRPSSGATSASGTSRCRRCGRCGPESHHPHAAHTRLLLSAPTVSACAPHPSRPDAPETEPTRLPRGSPPTHPPATPAPQVDPEYADQYSAIALTHNFSGSPHIDTENVGPFYGLSLGGYRKGLPVVVDAESGGAQRPMVGSLWVESVEGCPSRNPAVPAAPAALTTPPQPHCRRGGGGPPPPPPGQSVLLILAGQRCVGFR
jgi:hypothetical protein